LLARFHGDGSECVVQKRFYLFGYVEVGRIIASDKVQRRLAKYCDYRSAGVPGTIVPHRMRRRQLSLEKSVGAGYVNRHPGGSFLAVPNGRFICAPTGRISLATLRCTDNSSLIA
jgi:hypothetical protein